MREELFRPTLEGEARLLLLINAFTTERRSLEGRTKLAKLDFLLRYPRFFRRALRIRAPSADVPASQEGEDNIEQRMVRFRYGPWDPAYFALLGSLIGRQLVVPVPLTVGIGYRTTQQGQEVAKRLASAESWQEVALRAQLLKRHLDLSGATLTRFVYDHFPEVAQASWSEEL